MTNPKSTAPDFELLRSHHIVRYHEGAKFFGYGSTAIAAKIKSGQIPEPKYLSDDGRSRGWTGDQIISWRQATEEAQAARKVVAEKTAKLRGEQIKAGLAKKKAARRKKA
jgi:predicted DNA-binding transcriptional regulator AlpA